MSWTDRLQETSIWTRAGGGSSIFVQLHTLEALFLSILKRSRYEELRSYSQRSGKPDLLSGKYWSKSLANAHNSSNIHLELFNVMT